MRTLVILISIPILLFILPLSVHAYWPTTLEGNLAVSADPDTIEAYPYAIPYSGGRILVVFKELPTGMCYQIVDKFGNLIYDDGQPLIPELLEQPTWFPNLISDGEGGAFTAWSTLGMNPNGGIYAQRLDSQGNRMWGDSGVRIFPLEEHDISICVDGVGGFYLAVSPDEPALDWTDLWVQRIGGDGSLPWGDQGVLVAGIPDASARHPRITHDGNGGMFVIWEDSRPPYWPEGGLLAQHLDGDGNTLWPNDLFITQGLVWEHKVISDGEGGFILQTNYGADWNTHRRIDGNGNFLWTRTQLSWYFWADMVPGEPGYFYLSYTNSGVVYGQRMSFSGMNYWPLSGAPMSVLPPGWGVWGYVNSYYQSPHLYTTYFYSEPNDNEHLYVQALDSTGARLWDDMGVHLTVLMEQYEHMEYLNVVPDDEGGAAVVFERNLGCYDVYAKRCNVDGSLGGPFPIPIEISPLNPPVQIPASGGSFDFTIELSNEDSTQMTWDVWTNVLLPNGSLIGPLMGPVSLVMPPNFNIERVRTQAVPENAPPGTYTYQAWVGIHPAEPWTSDSFTFEKLTVGDGGVSVNDWTNTGESFADWIADTALEIPADFTLLSIYPNPFNAETNISFLLSDSGYISLNVYDISGKEVAELKSGFCPKGRHKVSWLASGFVSGIYFVQLKTERSTATEKLLLLK